ncbi:hypothetical protein DFR86_03715 [Acidianus sulfidivorans JP7]|uniref:hypothetical protein n=1 Tax=Acidianus sulfidivorans TaxID=312539 RepID=UPI0013A579E4|nr:hypothetical protein [Acidianus sulfidivorans]AWR96749.2 hypothetical protein DFR86_03715 [Acidianus sulfidivorans JP7]
MSRLLYYIQRLGDLNPKILGVIAGIKDAEELISLLKAKYEYRTYPLFSEKPLGLDKYIFTIYSKKRFSLINCMKFLMVLLVMPLGTYLILILLIY